MDDVFRLSVAEASDLFAESAFAFSRLARIKAPHDLSWLTSLGSLSYFNPLRTLGILDCLPVRRLSTKVYSNHSKGIPASRWHFLVSHTTVDEIIH